jgi:pyruvate/2-oxoglutarate dehydrogenase complex dihydrolipoamide dehydrogenase (E3) component
LVRGEARLDGERRVLVGEDLLIARDAVVLAVGSGALFPPIPGLAEAGAWSNRGITTAQSVPERLLILGGGIVGVEMAQAWASLGAKVTLIEALDRLIAREEPFAGELVADALREVGVDVHLGQKASEVRREGDAVTVQLEGGESFSGDRLVVAIGREPLTDALGLDTVGLEPGRYVDVDDHLQVPGHPWLYAIGDVNGRSLLTHSGKYQGRIAADHILGVRTGAATVDTWGPPRVIFTDPQVAAVGKTLEQAREEGLPVLEIDLETEGSAGGSFYGHGRPGTTRFVVDTEREILVGVTFVGFEVADFLQAATIAVVGQVPVSRLAHAMAPFPTRSELWLYFLRSYEQKRGETVHATPVELE